MPDGGELRIEGCFRFAPPVAVHARRGGERIVLPGRSHSHTLKQALQDAAVAPWEREHLPLLSAADGTLLAAGDRALSATLAERLRARDSRLAWTPP